MAAEAQLTWRVSVKVVRDEFNNRFVETCIGGTNDGLTCDPDVDCPGGSCIEWTCTGGTRDGLGCNIDAQCPSGECIGDLNTDAEIIRKYDTANAILRNRGEPDVPGTEERGYRIDLLPIIDLTGLPSPPASIRACSNQETQFCSTSNDCPACVGGLDAGDPCKDDGDCALGTCTGTAACNHVSHWFYAPIIRDVRNAIRDAATADPVRWAWDHDAINVYILGSDGSGTAYDMVLIGQDLSSINTPFHELGHFFNLDHTHSGGGLSPDCVTGWDDHVADTLEDNCGDCPGGCWDRDQIANWNFPTECGGPCDYVDLSTADQHRVDQVYYNLMSYRPRREVLTPGQLDRMTDHSNGAVHHVASGWTRFVDWRNDSILQNGSSILPYQLVGTGLSHAASGDIVLIRRGTYDETMTIDQDVTLRATMGDAVIGLAP
jgi:hypothetical protein